MRRAPEQSSKIRQAVSVVNIELCLTFDSLPDMREKTEVETAPGKAVLDDVSFGRRTTARIFLTFTPAMMEQRLQDVEEGG